MIIGIGTDLCNTERIRELILRYDVRFITRIFTQNEIRTCTQTKQQELYYAKRFAAKEACVKALGTGFAGSIVWTDVEILRHPSGKPTVTLHGPALKYLNNLLPDQSSARIHLTISDEPPYAQAFVVIEAVEL